MHALKAIWPVGTIKRLFGSQPSEEKSAFTAAPTPPPSHQTPPPVHKQAPKPAAPAPAPSNVLRLPLMPIFNRLSPALASLANREQLSANDEIALAVDGILAQLPSGIVRISFGELRKSAPAGIFSEEGSHDYSLIDLPLPEILARLHPSLLSRSANRKRVEVPEDVSGVFGKNGTAKLATPQDFQPAPARQTQPADPAPEPQPRAVAPAPQPKVVAPAPAPVQPIAPAMPIAMPKPVAAPVAAKPEPIVEPIVVPLASLTESWPEAIRAELAHAKPAAVSLSIPMSRLEGPMKTGKLTFAWSQLRQWIAPAPLFGQSPNDMTQVSLALNVVAPLFFAHVSRRASAKKKMDVASDIPDVFGSTAANAVRELKPTEPAVVPRATTPVADVPVTSNQLRMVGHPATAVPEMKRGPVPSLEPAEVPSIVQFAKQAPAQKNGNGNGNGHHAEAPANGNANGFPKIDWTPEQAVKLTCVTPGVGGAMISTDDGLMVATQLPAQFKSETLSAFVPQIFRHATQSLSELQTAPLSCVRLTLGDTQCEIFKTGKLYYVIISRPGEELPEAFLRKVAGELTKRN